jgi:hypothetical protein
MSTADATREDAPPGAEDVRPYRHPAGAPAPPSSPAMSAGWLLRGTALTAVVAGVMGVVVAPGVRGNAGEAVVDWVERLAATSSYFLLIALLVVVAWGAVELVRGHEAEAAPRFMMVGSTAGVVALVVLGVLLRDRRAEATTILQAASATVCVIAGAYAAARAPHTRAAAGVLIALAFASIVRLAAWELAKSAGERADMMSYSVSRGLATAAILLESSGVLVAATWLGTRSKLTGQLGSVAALALAVYLTVGVANGRHSGAAPWQAILHNALADAPGIPPPFGWLDSVAVLLVPASLLLALVSAAQPQQVAAMVSAVALALVSQGAFDAPLRALCAVAAAQWAALAAADERAMWRTLIEDRKRKLAEEA